MPSPTRIERDSLGEIAVPADKLWGAQTQRAIENFPIGGERMPLPVIHALGRIKAAAARANQTLDTLDTRLADLIAQAASEVTKGRWDDHFPLPPWQTGSGTQTNMNVNEVVANRAIQLAGGVLGSKDPVHPNDHVNKSQSSNDAFPTAMHLAVLDRVHASLLPALDILLQTLAGKAKEFSGITKLGRTHLQDAVPLPLSAEVNAWASQIGMGRAALLNSLPGLYQLALGGTAVGTGLGAAMGFKELAVELLAEDTGWPLTPAADAFAGLAGHEALVRASSALAQTATSLMKMANDIRWLASGPRAGLGELQLPANEPGSSIMPGKVNPTQCEAMIQAAVQVLAENQAVLLANGMGNFQLNVMKPLMVRSVLLSVELLADCCSAFAGKALKGLEADAAAIRKHVESSLMLVTALSPVLGYDKAAKIAHKAHAEGTTLRKAALDLGWLSEEEFDELVKPEKLAKP